MQILNLKRLIDIKVIFLRSFTTKVSEHIPSGSSMSSISSFKDIENKHYV